MSEYKDFVAKQFANRHIGPRHDDITHMLATIGESSLSGLIAKVIPDGIRQRTPLTLDSGIDEPQALAELKVLAERNLVLTSMIGQSIWQAW